MEKSEAGDSYAFYEATLRRRGGRDNYTVFSGQVYALQRHANEDVSTAILPDKGVFNFFKPTQDMQRVKIEDDPEFEKKFEIYSTNPNEARHMLESKQLRRHLLVLRRSGPLFAYVGPTEAMVAVSGKDRFEPGSMFRRKAGEERVRLMFDDVCASLQVLDVLKSHLAKALVSSAGIELITSQV